MNTKTKGKKKKQNGIRKDKGHANVLLARQSAAITLQFILCGAVRTSDCQDESKASERSKFVNVSQMRTAGRARRRKYTGIPY